MVILLKLPLDVVCVVESCFAVWRTSGRVLDLLDPGPGILFKVDHGSGWDDAFANRRCSKRVEQQTCEMDPCLGKQASYPLVADM